MIFLKNIGQKLEYELRTKLGLGCWLDSDFCVLQLESTLVSLSSILSILRLASGRTIIGSRSFKIYKIYDVKILGKEIQSNETF